jgi:hypothetical protein
MISNNSFPYAQAYAYADNAYFAAQHCRFATKLDVYHKKKTFADSGVSRGQRGGSLTVVNFSFLDQNHYFSLKKVLIYPYEAEKIASFNSYA